MWEARSPWSFFRQRIGQDWEDQKVELQRLEDTRFYKFND